MASLGGKSKGNIDDILFGQVVHSKKEALRDHDIYEKTRTMPN